MKKTLFVILLVFIATACSKEEKISRNLWKQNGTWNVESYYHKIGSEETFILESTIIEYGSILFYKNGTGLQVFGNGGYEASSFFTYTHTEEQLIIVFDDSNHNEWVYDMDWKKNEMRLSYDKTAVKSNGYLYYNIEKMHLKKKK
ncbi:MAG TPA: membrane lipoprotein lipid attachment site-containing protein [Brumimicrobium sp.]|nr:membrane lipoprotein lipid attachment site-containing protein [Brumimicrobium sp.]